MSFYQKHPSILLALQKDIVLDIHDILLNVDSHLILVDDCTGHYSGNRLMTWGLSIEKQLLDHQVLVLDDFHGFQKCLPLVKVFEKICKNM